jgi:hypothetical protein
MKKQAAILLVQALNTIQHHYYNTGKDEKEQRDIE